VNARRFVGLLLFVWLVSACQSSIATIESATHSSLDVLIPSLTSPTTQGAQSPIQNKPSQTPVPNPHNESSVSPTATSKPDTPNPEIPTLTPTHTTSPSLSICSPLVDQELSELAEIVSGPYDPPPMGKDDRHQGVDFAYYRRGEKLSIEGVEVAAIFPGWVACALDDRIPYGNMVMIETPQDELPPALVEKLGIVEVESLYHLYAHFGEAPLVELGDWVECGQVLGQVGATGYNIVQPHLHLETRIGPAGARFEGMAYYDTRATEDEMGNYELWRMSGEFRHFDPMWLFP
jgi:murein DD-endopeptidase MepM/ murein hydrolase activator NlpD